MSKDIALEDGEVQIGFNGDFLVARDDEVLLQEVDFRLHTVPGDWVLEPQCGAGLEFLIGAPNTPDTALLAQQQITAALTHDGMFTGALKGVEVFALNREQLAAMVLIDSDSGDTLTDLFTLDLKEGVLTR